MNQFAQMGIVGKAGAQFDRGRVERQGVRQVAAGNQYHGQGEPLDFVVRLCLQNIVQAAEQGEITVGIGSHTHGDGKAEVMVLLQHRINFCLQ